MAISNEFANMQVYIRATSDISEKAHPDLGCIVADMLPSDSISSWNVEPNGRFKMILDHEYSSEVSGANLTFKKEITGKLESNKVSFDTECIKGKYGIEASVVGLTREEGKQAGEVNIKGEVFVGKKVFGKDIGVTTGYSMPKKTVEQYSKEAGMKMR